MSSCSAGVAVEDDPDQGQQDQQEGEHRQEGRVRELTGQPPGLVIGVLADHRARHRGDRVALLAPIGPVGGGGDRSEARRHPCHPGSAGLRADPAGLSTDQAVPPVPPELGAEIPAVGVGHLHEDQTGNRPVPAEDAAGPAHQSLVTERVLRHLPAGCLGQCAGDAHEATGPTWSRGRVGAQEGPEPPGSNRRPGSSSSAAITWSPDRASGTE